MYKLSRLLLMCSVLFYGYCFVVVLLIIAASYSPWPAIIVAAVVAWRLRKRPAPRSTVMGSGRFADKEDLERAGMLRAPSGLILGRMPAQPGGMAAFKQLFNGRLNARDACQEFVSRRRRAQARLVRMPQAVHTAIFAPTGGGKGVSMLVPFLLSSDQSAVCVDCKSGELAKLTASHRRRMGQRIVLLDPWKLVTNNPDTFDPLDWIPDSPRAVDEANSLGNGLVVRTGEEKEPHWCDRAEAWIALAIAATARFGQKQLGTRSLGHAADMLSSPERMQELITLMKQSPNVWGGSLTRMAGQVSYSQGEELSSTMSTVARFIRFLNTPAVMDSTKSSSFNPSELRKGRMTVYLITPAEYLNSHIGLIRMWVVSLMGAVVRGGLR